MSKQGTEVDEIALLGAIYTNLAIKARHKGDLETADALDRRAEAFVAAEAWPVLRRVRVSLMNELATQRFREGKTEEAVEMMIAAVKLAPEGVAQAASVNLATFAQRRVTILAEKAGEDEVLAWVDQFRALPEVYERVAFTAWALVGTARLKRHDRPGADAAWRKAEQVRLTFELARLRELTTSDPDLAWEQWRARKVSEGDAALAAAKREVGATIALARAQKLIEERRCPEVDALVVELAKSDAQADGKKLRAACRVAQGTARWIANDFEAAAALLHEAIKLDPDEPAWPKKLVGLRMQQVGILLDEHRCAEAAKAIADGRVLAPGDQFFADAMDRCSGAASR